MGKKARRTRKGASVDVSPLNPVTLRLNCNCGADGEWTFPFPADTTVTGPLILKGARCPDCSEAVILPPGRYRASPGGLVALDALTPDVPEGLEHLAGTPLVVPFRVWLRQQASRLDAVGRFACAAREDAHAPLGAARDEWVKHLARCNAGSGAIEAFNHAWAEYEHKATLRA